MSLGELEMLPIRHLASDKFDDLLIRHLPSVEINTIQKLLASNDNNHRPLSTDELINEDIAQHPKAIPDTRSFHRRRPPHFG